MIYYIVMLVMMLKVVMAGKVNYNLKVKFSENGKSVGKYEK